MSKSLNPCKCNDKIANYSYDINWLKCDLNLDYGKTNKYSEPKFNNRIIALTIYPINLTDDLLILTKGDEMESLCWRLEVINNQIKFSFRDNVNHEYYVFSSDWIYNLHINNTYCIYIVQEKSDLITTKIYLNEVLIQESTLDINLQNNFSSLYLNNTPFLSYSGSFYISSLYIGYNITPNIKASKYHMIWPSINDTTEYQAYYFYETDGTTIYDYGKNQLHFNFNNSIQTQTLDLIEYKQLLKAYQQTDETDWINNCLP